MSKFNLKGITIDTLKEEAFIVDELLERIILGSETCWVSIYPHELTENVFYSRSDGYALIGKVRNILEKYKGYGLLVDYRQNGYAIRYQFHCEIVPKELKTYKTALQTEIGKREMRKARPSLIVNQSSNEFSFQSKSGIPKKATFTNDTNEYAILMYFINHQHQKFQSHHLVDQLPKKPRGQSNPDPKRRVKDAVKAIRDKLGKEVIATDKQSYCMDCEVVKV